MSGFDNDESSLAGSLLVATPLLLDPNFHRTVLYIAEHSSEGALGVVLNRPTGERVAAHLPDWGDLVSEPAVVFVGGPVANEVAVGLVRDPAVLPADWSPVVPGVGLLDLAEGPEAVIDVADARVFSGYSGWIGGQLEAELATDSWLLDEASAEDVFTHNPADLWRVVLRRRRDRGRLYAWLPDDLRSN